jgi:hypothetical protein
MAADPRPPGKLLDAIRQMELDDVGDEIDAMSDDEIAKAIDADGGDSKAIAARGAALAKALIQRRKDLQWQVEAHEKLDVAHAATANVGGGAKRTRGELIAIVKAAGSDEGFAMAARKGGVDEATDEELEDFVAQIEKLRALRDPH